MHPRELHFRNWSVGQRDLGAGSRWILRGRGIMRFTSVRVKLTRQAAFSRAQKLARGNARWLPNAKVSLISSRADFNGCFSARRKLPASPDRTAKRFYSVRKFYPAYFSRAICIPANFVRELITSDSAREVEFFFNSRANIITCKMF